MVSTTSILGYGFPEQSLRLAMARNPHFIGCDGGSTDPGPHYLGAGECLNSRAAMKRDLRLMLRAGVPAGVPVVIGSCGGAGGEPHLQIVAELAREVAREEGLAFRMALIHAEQKAEDVKVWLADGRVAALRNVPELTAEAVDRSSRIVGMMGAEPFVRALEQGAQVILAARASDAASWAACAMHMGLAPAPAWYSGKMLECSCASATPKGHDCLLVTVRDDHIDVEPVNPQRRCTTLSVATHALHENASPSVHEEPGGTLDATDCTFEALSDRAVRVAGMRWRPRRYDLKLEGAECVGFRAITICGTRDPVLIGQIEGYLEEVRADVARRAADIGLSSDAYRMVLHVYGKDGVMGAGEPVRQTASHELGIVIEVVAADQETARAVLAIARVVTPKIDFPGRLCKSGNMAFPFSPSDISVGPTYRFSVFHVVRQDDPLALFPIELQEVTP
ncbi:acyclic terpene utilization AtuA family protein [Pigmentiphaga soli]|uniref:Acyclic terpene utilization AtuA family protein n=2 Tax=Pigmentiphaga soli TaxID=1007095 RepID=A0ABP8HMS2_9BURK